MVMVDRECYKTREQDILAPMIGWHFKTSVKQLRLTLTTTESPAIHQGNRYFNRNIVNLATFINYELKIFPFTNVLRHV